MSRSIQPAEYTFTCENLDCTEGDGGSVNVSVNTTGNFPGGWVEINTPERHDFCCGVCASAWVASVNND